MNSGKAPDTRDIFIGVDLGGTNIRVKCSDRDGYIFNEDNVPTTSRRFGETLEENLTGIIDKAIASLTDPRDSVKAIGMGVPGIYYQQKILMSPNIDQINVDRLLRHYQEKGVAFYILNDVKCAAMGEQWKGAARNRQNFILINLGTGISVAPVLNGQVYLGEHCAAGEIAYWISKTGSTTGFGDGRVPLEEKFSGRWLGENIKTQLRALQLPDWPEQRIAPMTTKDIFEECFKGNAVIREMVDDAVQYLGTVLADICILLDPGLLIFSGGIVADLDYFLGYLQTYLQKTVPFPPEIICSSLNGDSGIFGAIALAIQNSQIA